MFPPDIFSLESDAWASTPSNEANQQPPPHRTSPARPRQASRAKGLIDAAELLQSASIVFAHLNPLWRVVSVDQAESVFVSLT
jgi:hypothetical protein